MFGGDVAVLMQILVQTIEELAQLKSILQNGSDTLGLLQDINRGINDSLQMAQTLGLRVDPGLYRDLKKVDQAVLGLEQIYGTPVDSSVATVQRNTDQTPSCQDSCHPGNLNVAGAKRLVTNEQPKVFPGI
jgi:hypothetical protein